MADLFDTLRKKYSSGYMKFAEALLFRSSDGTRRSLRVEADSIGLEFTDNIYLGVVVIPPRAPFGRDPEGCLFYNDIQDFKTPGSSSYKVTQETNPADGRDCLRVKFYHGSICYAQFLSHDPFKVATQTIMDNLTQNGQWAELNIGHATATITKDGNGYAIITAKSIGWQATISSGGGIFNSQNFVVEGNLSFKDIANISNGIVASCNNDRLLFFGTGWQSDFIAFVPHPFISFILAAHKIPAHDISPGALGFDQSKSASFSDTELKSGIRWTRI